MKSFYRIMPIVIAALIFISCSKKPEYREDNHTVKTDKDGLKIIENLNVPSVPKDQLNISFKKTGEIKSSFGEEENAYLLFGLVRFISQENILVLDQNMINILKFGTDFKLKEKLFRQGKGPGEIEFMINAFTMNNDTLYVFADHHIKFYTSEGVFLREKLRGEIFGNYGDIKRFERINDELFILSYNGCTKGRDEQTVFQEQLMLLDRNFRIKTKIKEFSYPYEIDKPMEYSLKTRSLKYEYAFSDSEIFVAEKTEDKYFIEVYDFTGRKKYSFTKSFRKIPYSRYEQTLINANVNKYMTVGGPDGIRTLKFGRTYKTVFNYLYYDNRDRLWVEVTTDDKSHNPTRTFDIFKDGVYLNSIKTDKFKPYPTDDFPLDPGGKLLEIHGKKIVFVDLMEGKIEVYDY